MFDSAPRAEPSAGRDPATTIAPLIGDGAGLEARATLLGRRIDVRGLGPRIADHPVVIETGAGWAAVFRYGVVVTFGVSAADESAFFEGLRDRITEPIAERESERADVRVASDIEEGVGPTAISVRDASLPRLQVIAGILAKSVALAHQEESIAEVFADIEPLAANVSPQWSSRQRPRRLLAHISRTLLIQYEMVGRVEVLDKPELLWERPDLERLYLRLEEEYELSDRHLALERKLALIGDTAETMLDLLHAKRGLRVEWYIVILIVVEIALTLYDLFLRP